MNAKILIVGLSQLVVVALLTNCTNLSQTSLETNSIKEEAVQVDVYPITVKLANKTTQRPIGDYHVQLIRYALSSPDSQTALTQKVHVPQNRARNGHTFRTNLPTANDSVPYGIQVRIEKAGRIYGLSIAKNMGTTARGANWKIELDLH